MCRHGVPLSGRQRPRAVDQVTAAHDTDGSRRERATAKGNDGEHDSDDAAEGNPERQLLRPRPAVPLHDWNPVQRTYTSLGDSSS
jgi:hypothetical protein